VARTLFVVVVVFAVCRVPFTALIILRHELQRGTQTKNQVSLMLSIPFYFTYYSFNDFKEIKSRWNWKNACCYSVRNLLPLCL
jgi:hypothetical protein